MCIEVNENLYKIITDFPRASCTFVYTFTTLTNISGEKPAVYTCIAHSEYVEDGVEENLHYLGIFHHKQITQRLQSPSLHCVHDL